MMCGELIFWFSIIMGTFYQVQNIADYLNDKEILRRILSKKEANSETKE